MLGDIKSKKLIIVKGVLFLFIGLLGLVLVAMTARDIWVVMLAAISIWGFCRCYYFAFYVLEHYVDSGYKYAGLWSASYYIFKKPKDNKL